MYGEILRIIGYSLDAIGILLVLFGALLTLAGIARLEAGKPKGKFRRYEEAKRNFTQKLILGLDFLIAGDIVRTVVAPGIDELASLAAIVAIRTVLSYFLTKEEQLGARA